jgi:hypothetical protein
MGYPDGSPIPHWWDTPGSLRMYLLRFDGRAAVAVNAEKQVVDPALVLSEAAGQLRRIGQQMSSSRSDEAVKKSGRKFGFESVKPYFTREEASIRRHVG